MSAVRKALEPVPFGSPVRAEADGCVVAVDLTGMIGVARRCGNPGQGYAVGEEVQIQTDDGISTRLAADGEVVVRGAKVRLLATDSHYVHLRGGKIVGFLGDGREA